MAIIKKTGNQIYKIYSPEMDISRGSLLSVTNDIAYLSSKARIIYRYDNKLEDYDIEWITYNENGDAWDIWYAVPADEQSAYFQQTLIRKTLYWDANLRLNRTIRYHESDNILHRIPSAVVYDESLGTLTNTGASTVTFTDGLSYDLDESRMLIQIMQDDIDVVISSYLMCKLRNNSLDDTITIPAGEISIGDSGYITVDVPFDILPGEVVAPRPYKEHYRFVSPLGGVALVQDEVFDISAYIEKSTQSPRKATHDLEYDVQNRMVVSRFRTGE